MTVNQIGFDIALTAARNNDWSPLIDLLEDDASCAFLHGDPIIRILGNVPAYVIVGIRDLLSDRSFLGSSHSSDVVGYVQSEWQRIGNDERRDLLPAIVEAYPNFADPVTWLLIAELLGEYYADEMAMDAFVTLARTAGDMSRSLLPAGLKYLVRSAHDPKVVQRARRMLRDLLSDSFEPTREEAADALNSLSQHGA
jgi:hypothetical protein